MGPVGLTQSATPVGGHVGSWAKASTTSAPAKAGDFPCWLLRLVLSDLLDTVLIVKASSNGHIPPY